TSVTLCAPGSSSNCQTIDHIQVDTGSAGLRIIGSVLSSTLSLPQQVDAAGNPLAECAQFVDGYTWGAVRVADLHIAGEQASSTPIQVIGDASFPTVPFSCSSSGPAENTVQSFGANGLLGVGVFLQDCGSACAQAAVPGTYYVCPAVNCQPTAVALAKQLQNPVALFSADNNGVILQLPSVPAAGAATATGSLIFGIGTQSDNGLGGATVLGVNPSTGNIVTTFNNQTYTNSYIDGGASLLADDFPLAVLDLEDRQQSFRQVAVLVELDVGRHPRVFDFRERRQALCRVGRVGRLHRCREHHNSVIEVGRVQADVLVVTRFVFGGERLPARPGFQRGAGRGGDVSFRRRARQFDELGGV